MEKKQLYQKDFTMNQLVGQYQCKIERGPGMVALSPQVIDLLADDCVLIDIYGKTKTKAEFEKDRNGRLYPSKNGGVTIYYFQFEV